MKGYTPERPAVVARAEDLDALADRCRQRGKRLWKDTLAMAADVHAARRLAKRGQWGPWCERAGLGSTHAWHYVELGKLSVTESFKALTEDEQQEEWQRIQGNRPEVTDDDRRGESGEGGPDPDPEPEGPDEPQEEEPAPPRGTGEEPRTEPEPEEDPAAAGDRRPDTKSLAVLLKERMEKVLGQVWGIEHQYGSAEKVFKSKLWKSSTRQEREECVEAIVEAAGELTRLAEAASNLKKEA